MKTEKPVKTFAQGDIVTWSEAALAATITGSKLFPYARRGQRGKIRGVSDPEFPTYNVKWKAFSIPSELHPDWLERVTS